MYQRKTQKWVLSVTIIALFFSFSISCFAFEKEIKTMASALSESILKAGRKTIAVVDFNDLQGNVTELGRFFAEEFSVALASAGKGFEVVDRTNLKTILIEHKLSTTGIIDPQTARKLGQIAGVDALITGTITPFGDTVRITVKILDTNTARVIGASSGDIAKTKAIEELLGKGIGDTFQTSAKTSLTASNTPSQMEKSEKRAVSNGFTFDLRSCKLSGTTIVCEVIITNTEKDRRLTTTSRRMRIIDEFGNEIVGRGAKVGENESACGDCDVVGDFVTNIPIKSTVKFEDVDPAANRLNLFEIKCYSDGDFLVQFRNISITK